MTNAHFEVDRTNFSQYRYRESPLEPLNDGQVRLRIDRFALTANNISYALTGDQLGYWDFFPTGDAGWGRIPAMGWGDVVESRHLEIEVGGRYYGWYPMSRFITLDARPSSTGLVDNGAHREAHAPIYRAYQHSVRDALYNAEREDEHALLRGLFATAFLAEDFFFDNDFFAASTNDDVATVILSASSKTAIGLAFLAKERNRGRVVGVTSGGNQAFVESLGYYNEVVLYDNLETLDANGVLLVDMSGNGEVVGRLHHHLQDKIKYSMAVGASHWDSAARPKDLPGPAPTFFFAPQQAAKRMQDWGAGGYEKKVAEAMGRFVDASNAWLHVERVHGGDAIGKVYEDLVGGRISPQRGLIASLH